MITEYDKSNFKPTSFQYQTKTVQIKHKLIISQNQSEGTAVAKSVKIKHAIKNTANNTSSKQTPPMLGAGIQLGR